MTTGLYGKLPAHGDFIQHDMPPEFISVWDSWLQHAIMASQEELEGRWLELYLVSPIWKFALSKGVVDQEHHWFGMMLPSVDSVGRYYPLTIARKVSAHMPMLRCLEISNDWFDDIENIALTSLQNGLRLENMAGMLGQISIPEVDPLTALGTSTGSGSQKFISLPDGPSNLESAFSLIADYFMNQNSKAFSLWWTAGGEHIAPIALVADKLPKPVSYTALLDGNWQNWYWEPV